MDFGDLRLRTVLAADDLLFVRFLLNIINQESVIMMSIRDYIKNIASAPTAYQAIRQDAKSKGSASLSLLEIDREIAEVRKQQAKEKRKPFSK